MTVIIDYGCGNPASIGNMLRKLGFASVISGSPEDIRRADRLILPGVGKFDFGMSQLKSLGLDEALHSRVIADRIPILGICLGVQLFCRGSEEGELPGLGWIDADCLRFDAARMEPGEKIPHMGWTDIQPLNDAGLFRGGKETPRFYFVHSYHLQCDRDDFVAARANYGYGFAAAIVKDNIVGVQFHPEKSHVFGMTFLDNFMRKFPATA